LYQLGKFVYQSEYPDGKAVVVAPVDLIKGFPPKP
jgi:hypothetical protein